MRLPDLLIWVSNRSLIISKNITNIVVFITTFLVINSLLILARLSFITQNFFLKDFVVYEVLASYKTPQLTFAVFYNLSKIMLNNSVLFGCILKKQNFLRSIEIFFRNAKWLEQEQLEMFNLNILNKNDKRSFLITPWISTAPLRRAYPTCGLLELFVCSITNRLAIKYTGGLN